MSDKNQPLLQRMIRGVLIKASVPLTIALILLAGVGFYHGSKVALKLSLTDLLPEDYPAVEKFKKLTDVVGGVGFFAIVLHAEDGVSHKKIAPKVIDEILTSPMIQSASFKRERKFFTDRMLYYLSVEELIDMKKNLRREIGVARSKIFDLGLWDEEKKNKNREKVFDEDMTDLGKKSANLTDDLISEDGKTLLVMAKPGFDSTDLEKCRELIAFVEGKLKEILPANVTYDFAERYYFKTVEVDMIQGDIYWLGTIALLLIGLVIWWYFRSFIGMVVVFVPVLVGLGITMGFTALFIGHINIITGFLIGILSGLGVDYSIHMFLRLKLEQREPSSDDPDPAWRALASTGHSVFVGSMAAAGAFFLLSFSDFKAFSEFGIICGFGIVAVFIALVVNYKCLSVIFEKVTLPADFFKQNRMKFPVLSVPRGLVGGTLATVVVCLLAFKVSFLFDFDRMMRFSDKVTALTNLVNDIYGRSVVPSAVATKTKEEAEEVERIIKDKYYPEVVNDIVSGATIIPENQAAKQPIMESMLRRVKKLPDSRLEEATGIPGHAIRRWLAAKPFTFEEIPQHVADSLRGDHEGFLMYLYPAVMLGQYDGIKTYAGMFRDLEEKNPDILTGSDAVIFSDILDLIQRDGTIILLGIFLSVGFFIWINVRHTPSALLSYLPLILALPVGMGLMVIFGVQFNILNITIIPSFVALGIDVPIHIVHRARETRSGYKAVQDIAPSVNLALLTAVFGFGVLVFARAGVLQSLGWIALLGTVAIWWVGLFLLPAFIEWVYRRQDKKAEKNRPTPINPTPPSNNDSDNTKNQSLAAMEAPRNR